MSDSILPTLIGAAVTSTRFISNRLPNASLLAPRKFVLWMNIPLTAQLASIEWVAKGLQKGSEIIPKRITQRLPFAKGKAGEVWAKRTFTVIRYAASTSLVVAASSLLLTRSLRAFTFMAVRNNFIAFLVNQAIAVVLEGWFKGRAITAAGQEIDYWRNQGDKIIKSLRNGEKIKNEHITVEFKNEISKHYAQKEHQLQYYNAQHDKSWKKYTKAQEDYKAFWERIHHFFQLNRAKPAS